MSTVCISLKPEADIEAVWQELQDAGVHLLYSDEEPEGAKLIYGILQPEISAETLLLKLPAIEHIADARLPEIDWQAQWETHGHDFSEGFVHLSVQDFGYKEYVLPHWSTLRLQPGPGFGDLSHPTTRLVLELMSKHVKGMTVIDVGCGSGVLALAAKAMGAGMVWGIDIDSLALEHARKNASLNGMEEAVKFCLPEQQPKIQESVVLLMNMISSEQKEAWDSLSEAFPEVSMALTSGIRCEERQKYLKLVRKWGWKPVKEIEKDGWLGFQCFGEKF